MIEAPETFWSLLHDAAHWEFECFLMLLDNVLLGMVIWPLVKKHWTKYHSHKHECCDEDKKD